MDMGQNPVPLVNIKIAGKWMSIPLKMVSIGIDPYPNFFGRSHRVFMGFMGGIMGYYDQQSAMWMCV